MAELGLPGSPCLPPRLPYSNHAVTQPQKQVSAADFIQTSNKFGLNVFMSLSKEDSFQHNSIISPKSFIDATQITAVGAHGNTKAQIENALGGMPQIIARKNNGPLKQIAKNIFKKMSSIDGLTKSQDEAATADTPPPPTSPFIVVNRICVRKGMHLTSSFVSTIKSMFGAKADSMDFHGNPEKCVDTINSWVGKHTEGKIQSIVGRDDITAETSVIIVNAIYFKGEWENKFDKSNTRPKPFKSANGTIKTEFMFKKSKTLYFNDDELKCSAVELPYVGGELSFVVLLPNSDVGLQELESHLDVPSLERIFHGMKPEADLLLYLPKFKVETAAELSPHFKELGVVDLFSRTKADLRGIESKGQLYVSAIAHKACIEVNEEGTEAAAATAGILRAAGGRSKQYTIFDADHPFIFLIKDRTTDSILFIGKYCTPQ